MAEALEVDKSSEEEEVTEFMPPMFIEPGDEPINVKINRLVKELLENIESFVDQEEESIPFLAGIHTLAEAEDGWLALVDSAVHTIPVDHPYAASAINIIFEDCPLPCKETSIKLTEAHDLNETSVRVRTPAGWPDLNMCMVLGRLAEKLTGPHSEIMLTDGVLHYLTAQVRSRGDHGVILAALLALEKFATSLDNRKRINEQLRVGLERHPLIRFESYIECKEPVRRSLGFSAQWALDNTFLDPERPFSYLAQDMSGVNVILNPRDSSDYLKLRSNGLEARCDSYSFESTRATFKITSGCWYYEAMPITSGVMQVGWATGDSPFMNYDGYGIGDDAFSVGYDGNRRLIWFNARPSLPDEPDLIPTWRLGDVVGCLLDCERRECVFTINGMKIASHDAIFNSVQMTMITCGLFPAASLMTFQQCRFNFGKDPFRFPPRDRAFGVMNRETRLTPEQREVLPKRTLIAKMLQEISTSDENALICPVCYGERPDARLQPCDHGLFCSSCGARLIECPFCRCPVTSFRTIASSSQDDAVASSSTSGL